MRRFDLRPIITLVLALALVVPAANAAEPVDNIIILIPDGCDANIQTLARWYKGAPLAIDDMISGSVSTYMSNSVITGSAAAATAFATGHKTTVRFLGIGPSADDVLSNLPTPPQEIRYKPLATVLEGAKLAGKATGLISTSRITHATPAAYAVHIQDRGWDNEIMEHLVYQDIDVVFGGGNRHLLPTDLGGRRTDGENLREDLRLRGYQLVDTKHDLAAAGSRPVWGMFASSHMAADIDRAEFAADEPSIAEMTSKAIETLSTLSPGGFFLMVEGSQVDWAGHANDPIYMVTDFLAFDAAVEAALDFAKNPANGRTLVLAFPDHNTGGMTIGNYSTAYTELSIEDMLAPLEGMKISAYGIANKIGSDTSAANIKANILEWWGLDLDTEHIDEIISLVNSGASLDTAIANVVSAYYTDFGWTTFGHTGGDVPLWSYGPDRPVGHHDNTDLAQVVADAFGFDLEIVDELLFQEISEHFANAVFDETDPENPVVRVGGCEMPVSKNIVTLSDLGIEFPMPGLTVHAPATGKTYVPMLAVALVRAVEGSMVNAQALEGMSTTELAEALGVDHTRIFSDHIAVE
jgi:alkaline phosphatase